ncbi:MAG: KamA family protein [Deltaproteobacteria bacterium]|nr:KamA family protein [Deltaproteobacteria bacterium]
MQYSKTEIESLLGVRAWVMRELEGNENALSFYRGVTNDTIAFNSLKWRDFAAIRLLDYIDHAGMTYQDKNLRGELAVNNPVKMIWLAVNYGTGGATPAFFEDMIQLFRQFQAAEPPDLPDREQVERWMERYPTGLDPRIIKLREENRDRILNLIIDKIDSGAITSSKYTFSAKMSREQKFLKALEWWQDYRFHLRFAVRSADLLNEMLGNSLDPDTMEILYSAEKKRIPIFVNPYYLSLLHVRVPYFAIGADLAIRHYVIYTKQLVQEFGHIVAWEKEDMVRPGEPNAAGWLLPSDHIIHRRYPEVAILIPETGSRACGGLCAPCQRMYRFQKGHLNFDLKKLRPTKNWLERLYEMLTYFEEDSQLRDILITGGDALMSSNHSLEQILNSIYEMAYRKKKANKQRKNGEKYAEIIRIRLGTRLPVYLPQRITDDLIAILAKFRNKAATIGIQQFVIQTHFESPMEITPEARDAAHKLHRAGWIITNQHVFTAASSRRGHNGKLRQSLNEIGVLPYYTFSVKGYMENNFNFALNARAMQEQVEEKIYGTISGQGLATVVDFQESADDIVKNIDALRRTEKLPFLATDRTVLNLPGVGKSLSFRVIGITRYGRRILQFDHDQTRRHSPIIEKLGKMIVIESKSVSEYLDQLIEMGENPQEYKRLYGYSIGATDERMPIYEYPAYDFRVTEEMTNLDCNNQT